MPPHHHHPHCHCSPSSSSCCCCLSSPPSPCPDQLLLQTLINNQVPIPNSVPPPPPPPSSSQLHLLQTLLASQLLSQPQAPKPQRQSQQKDTLSETQSLLLSLLRRVAALESRIPDLSPPPRPASPEAAPRWRPVSEPPRSSKLSVRDAAARIIQARFREFLVRRSRTLRQLKHLAVIKSHAAALRSALSRKNGVADPEQIAQGAVDLLLQLDSIQSSDPMIREGKRSVCKELNRILKFIDMISPKNHQIPTKGNGSGNQRRPAPASASVRRVTFARFREETNPSHDAREPFVDEFIDLDGRAERLSNGIERIGLNSKVSEDDEEEEEEEAQWDAEDGVRHGMSGQSHGQNGKMGLYASMPVQMEPRRS